MRKKQESHHSIEALGSPSESRFRGKVEAKASKKATEEWWSMSRQRKCEKGGECLPG